MEKMLWAVIKQSKANHAYLEAKTQYKNLVGILSGYDVDTIIGLDDVWSERLRELKDYQEFEKLHVQDGGIVSTGDDGFYMDFASWVLAQGEELFESFKQQGNKAIIDYIKSHNIGDDDYTFECMSYAFHDAKRKVNVNKATVISVDSGRGFTKILSGNTDVEESVLKMAKGLLNTGICIDKVAVHIPCTPDELLNLLNKHYPQHLTKRIKYLRKMWMIFDVLFFDKEQAEAVEDGKEVVKKVYVGLDNDGIELPRDGFSADYVGSWVYTNEHQAEEAVKEFNQA